MSSRHPKDRVLFMSCLLVSNTASGPRDSRVSPYMTPLSTGLPAGWDVESPERPSRNAPGRGTGWMGISKWKQDEPVPGCLPWVVAQPQQALCGRKPWVPRHLARPASPLQSGQKDQDGSWGLRQGTPTSMAPAGRGRGIRAEHGPGSVPPPAHRASC